MCSHQWINWAVGRVEKVRGGAVVDISTQGVESLSPISEFKRHGNSALYRITIYLAKWWDNRLGILLTTGYFSLVCVHSQVVDFNCTTFCPEVTAKYHCVITSTVARWTVSGSVTGANSFGAAAAIGDTLPIGSSFTANKTGSNSFSLNFTANVEFNNSVTVECADQNDANMTTNSRQCTIKLEGKRGK